MTFAHNFRFRIAVSITLSALIGAVVPANAADDLDKVIARLDASAKTFTSAEADIKWDNTQVQPVPDTDSQVGTVLFARGKDGQMQVALHIKSDNGQPVQKDMVYSDGVGKLYEAAIKQLQVFKVGDKSAQLESFLTLGFGGSGQDLKKNWNITSEGTEQVNGVSAAKLQLAPRDAAVAKTAPKVLLWIDLDKGLAVKQQRFDATGNYVVFTYTNIHPNAKAGHDAFNLKTPKDTTVVNH
jgi:outer membrane lipoprotein-sorting protein